MPQAVGSPNSADFFELSLELLWRGRLVCISLDKVQKQGKNEVILVEERGEYHLRLRGKLACHYFDIPRVLQSSSCSS